MKPLEPDPWSPAARRESISRRAVREVAEAARKADWDLEDDPLVAASNMTAYFADTVLWLYVELAGWTECASAGRSRGERRKARRVAHSLAKALIECKQDRDRVEAVVAGSQSILLGAVEVPLRVVPGPLGYVRPDSSVLMYNTAKRMYFAGLLSERDKTVNRAYIQVNALRRLGLRLEDAGCVPPVARVRGGARRDRVADGRDGRGESKVCLVREEETEEEGGGTSVRVRGGAAHPAPVPAVRDGRASAARPRTRGGAEMPVEMEPVGDDGWEG